MKFAITAATGQLGRAIVQAAIKKFGKDNVIGIARTPSKGADMGIELREGDYTKPEHFKSAFQGVDVAVLISGMDKPQNRIQQHRNIIEGAKVSGIKKIIYTSICGKDGHTTFDPVIQSNRQTEKDIQESGMDWIIGRNGLYIEADLEAIPEYIKHGQINNSAGSGLCSYTSRQELAAAYVHLIENDILNNQIYNLCGEAYTQQELADAINKEYGINIKYKELTVEKYLEDRTNAHGDFLGTIIAGIYQGIREGNFNIESDFQKVCGRKHLSLQEMIHNYKEEHNRTL